MKTLENRIEGISIRSKDLVPVYGFVRYLSRTGEVYDRYARAREDVISSVESSLLLFYNLGYVAIASYLINSIL